MTQKNSVTFSSKPNHAARQAHMQARQMFSEYDTSQIAPKKSKLPIVFGILIAVVVVLAIVGVAMHFFAGSGNSEDELLPRGETTQVTVVPGDDAELIAYTLFHAHLIADPTKFIRRVQALEVGSQLQAGKYTIEGGTSIDDIIAILIKGPGIQGIPLLIPEGASITYVAAEVEEVTEGRISAEEFLSAAWAPRWAEEFPFAAEAGEQTLEGMLFPATYGVGEEDTADDIIRMMLTKFKSVIANLDLSYAEQQGLSWYEWLKLASIVERESGGHGDEKGIASVFYNRLGIGMPLQSDATTAYAVGGVPTAEQLADTDDPYNTYERTGVSIPTPIGNPGLAAMEATCHPDSTEYFYFYAKTDKDGKVTTIFSRTYEEHLAAIASDD